MLKALFKPSIWKIIGLFYENKNKPIHLREIARRAGLNESTISSHLNNLVKTSVLKIETEANLKKFYVDKSQISWVFPLFDSERFDTLPASLKESIKTYFDKLKTKPSILLVSQADNKVELILVSGNDKDARSWKKETREKIREIKKGNVKFKVVRINENELKKEISVRKDVFPIFNAKYFYEVTNE